MAAESNLIQVVIESVNKMSQDLKQIEGDMRKLEGTTGTTEKAFTSTGRASGRLTTTLGPLRSLLVSLTGVTGGFGTALFNLVRFGLSPAGLAMSGLVVFISSLISRMIDAKKETELFTKSMEDQAIKIVDLNLRYRVLIGTMTAVQAGTQKIALQQAAEKEKLAEELSGIEKRLAVPEGGEATPLDPARISGDIKRREAILARLRQLGQELKQTRVIGETEKSQEDKKKQLQFLLSFVGADEDTVEVGSIEAIAAVEKIVQDMEEAARKSREKLIETLALSTVGQGDLFEIGDPEILVQIEKIADDFSETMKKKAKATAEEMADSFVDDFLRVMEGGKFKIQDFFSNLGRTVVTQFLRKALAETLVNPIFEFLKAGGSASGKGGSIFDIFNIFKLFGAGRGAVLPGNFVPIGPLRKFATGGMASGPTLGVIGEEGPEIVARMKPARPGDGNGGDIKQNIFLVDARPPRLGPRDVVLFVEADMRSGGPTARAVQNVIKRT